MIRLFMPFFEAFLDIWSKMFGKENHLLISMTLDISLLNCYSAMEVQLLSFETIGCLPELFSHDAH